MEVIWDSNSVLWAMNVFHLRPAAIALVTQAMADSAATVVGDAFNDPVTIAGTQLQAQIASTNRLHSVRLTDLRTINSPVFSSDILDAGGGDSIQLPDNVSLPVELQVSAGARNGRVYLWGFDDGTNAASGRPGFPVINACVHFVSEIEANIGNVTDIESLAVLSRSTNTTSDVINVRRSPTMTAAGWSQQKRRRDGLQLVV